MNAFLKKLNFALMATILLCVSGSYAGNGKYKALKQKLFAAIDAADLGGVKAIENINNLLSKTNESGRTPAQQAASLAKDSLEVVGMAGQRDPKLEGYLGIIEYLLQNGAKEKELLKNYPKVLAIVKAKK
jgi:hypothetical protein